MKRTNVLMWLIIFALVTGISAFGFSQTAAGQNNRCRQARDNERDDKDDDETLSAADKARVKITLEDARAIALKRVAGTIVDEELEKEHGRIQYAFDICSNDKLWDVEISAETGEVLQAVEEDDDDPAEDSAAADRVSAVFSAFISATGQK